MSDKDTSRGDILVVDDNPVNLDLLSNMLLDRKYRVRVATGGRRALTAARSCLPDLIMLDINMPDINGYEVCKQLKLDRSLCDVPVIFISALDEAVDKVKAFECGGADYVTKPFQIEEVLARVENQLKISRLQKEMEKKNDELTRKNEALLRSQEELIRSYERADLIFSALSDILPGTVLDEKYRLDTKIGEGGFGVVYQATHIGLNRPVAIKIFRPIASNVSPEGLKRFRLEGISACRVNHPNAISILDCGVSSKGIAYLVMELLQGHTLADELRKKWKLTPARCAEIIIPICDVLEEAHQAGIIHRDIKPDNIFLHQTKNGETVKVVDFGIAKLLDKTPNENIEGSATYGFIGTPEYMSPERLNNKQYDGRSDVYSIAIMLYQMLSGQVPFQIGENGIWEVALLHLTQDPEPLSKLNPNLPEDLDAVVLRALSKDSENRPTAKEMGDQLRKITGIYSDNETSRINECTFDDESYYEAETINFNEGNLILP
jgi:serine/threonine protein kinase/AmiR/NasT family two-component response regulator